MEKQKLNSHFNTSTNSKNNKCRKILNNMIRSYKQLKYWGV